MRKQTLLMTRWTQWWGWLSLSSSLVVVVVVKVVVGEGSGGSGMGDGLWCTPKLWEAKEWALHITHTDQGPQIWEIQSQFSVDVIGNRYASHESGAGMGTSYSVFRLFYYDANSLFTVQDGKCTTTHLEGNITKHCIDIPTKDAVEYMKEAWGGMNAKQIVSGGVRTRDSRGVGRFDSVDIDSPSLPLVKEIHGEIGGVHGCIYYMLTNHTVTAADPVGTSPSLSNARRLFYLILSHSACRLVFSVVELLASRDVHVTGNVSLIVTLVGLLGSAAFNPMMYALGVVMEQRGKEEKGRLIKQLKARMANKQLQRR